MMEERKRFINISFVTRLLAIFALIFYSAVNPALAGSGFAPPYASIVADICGKLKPEITDYTWHGNCIYINNDSDVARVKEELKRRYGGGSTGSGYTSGASSWEEQLSLQMAEQLGKSIGEFMVKFLFGDLSTPPKQMKTPKPPLVPEYKQNPEFMAAAERLEGHQLPPATAQYTLEQMLQTQRNTVATYLPKNAFQQLNLSVCLAQEGARRAAQSPESLEEASFLLYQSARSLEGGYVQGPYLQGHGIEPLRGPEPKEIEKHKKAIEMVKGLLEQVSIQEKECNKLNKDVEEKKATLKETEDNLDRLQRKPPETPRTPEEETLKGVSIKDALAAREEAKKDIEDTITLARNAEEELNQAKEKAQNAMDDLQNAFK